MGIRNRTWFLLLIKILPTLVYRPSIHSSIYASIVNIHDPPWLHFELHTPQLPIFDFDADWDPNPSF
jgi:hypothetical protein